MRAIGNGRIVMPMGVVENAALLFDEKIIGLVDADAIRAQSDVEWIDAKGAYVIPGLVDMHIHGYLGEDTSDGKVEGLVTMAEGIAKNGVTSWLPTTMTVSLAEILLEISPGAPNEAELLRQTAALAGGADPESSVGRALLDCRETAEKRLRQLTH